MIVPVLAPSGAGLALAGKSTVDGRLLPTDADEKLPGLPCSCAPVSLAKLRVAMVTRCWPEKPFLGTPALWAPGSLTRQRCDDQDGRYDQDDGRQRQFDQQ